MFYDGLNIKMFQYYRLLVEGHTFLTHHFNFTYLLEQKMEIVIEFIRLATVSKYLWMLFHMYSLDDLQTTTALYLQLRVMLAQADIHWHHLLQVGRTHLGGGGGGRVTWRTTPQLTPTWAWFLWHKLSMLSLIAKLLKAIMCTSETSEFGPPTICN